MVITRKQKEQHIRSLEQMSKKHSQWGDVLRRLLRNKLAMVGLAIVLIIVLAVVFADVISPYDYAEQNPTQKLQFPSAEHILVPIITQGFVFPPAARRPYIASRCAHVRCDIHVHRRWSGRAGRLLRRVFELIIMRLMDIIMSVPGCCLRLPVCALGNGLLNTALACAIGGIPSAVRLLRATVMSIGTTSMSRRPLRPAQPDASYFPHILPNTLAPLIVDTTLRIGGTIMMISGLSFVGLACVRRLLNGAPFSPAP
jgi:peptide/nickel transport system permease protein